MLAYLHTYIYFHILAYLHTFIYLQMTEIRLRYSWDMCEMYMKYGHHRDEFVKIPSFWLNDWVMSLGLEKRKHGSSYCISYNYMGLWRKEGDIWKHEKKPWMKGPIPIFLRPSFNHRVFPYNNEQSQSNAKPLVDVTSVKCHKKEQRRPVCWPRRTHFLIKYRPDMDHLKNRDPQIIFDLLKNCLIFTQDLLESSMRFAQKFPEIYLWFVWYLLEISLRFTQELPGICS